jgi:hypothetical protein
VKNQAKSFFVLMAACSASWAEWEITGRENDGQTTYYHDIYTIQKSGSFVTIWTMKDYVVRSPDKPIKERKSENKLLAFNCLQKTYAEPSAQDVSISMSQWKWNTVSSRTIIELQWKVACKEK